MSIQRFPEKLLTLRQRSGFSQQRIADELGVSRVFIHKLETGKKHPNVEHALKLAKLFKVSLDQLLDDDVALE